MPSEGKRYAFGVLVAVLAIVSAVFLIRGMKNDSLSLAVAGLAFVILIILAIWRIRNAKTHVVKSVAPFPLGDPKPALAPPDGHIRFTIAIENLPPDRVTELWSDLCRPGRHVTEAFRLLYRNFTILEGNRFRFLKGDPQMTAALLADVLSSAAGVSVRTTLEPAAERTPPWS
jgi:hypothetical protein